MGGRARVSHFLAPGRLDQTKVTMMTNDNDTLPEPVQPLLPSTLLARNRDQIVERVCEHHDIERAKVEHMLQAFGL